MGALFGGAKPAPIVRAPIREVEGPKTTTLDPDHGEAVAEARRTRLTLKKRSSRGNLITQLAIPNTDVRQGVTI